MKLFVSTVFGCCDKIAKAALLLNCDSEYCLKVRCCEAAGDSLYVLLVVKLSVHTVWLLW